MAGRPSKANATILGILSLRTPPYCPRCGLGALVVSWGIVSCLACGYEPAAVHLDTALEARLRAERDAGDETLRRSLAQHRRYGAYRRRLPEAVTA